MAEAAAGLQPGEVALCAGGEAESRGLPYPGLGPDSREIPVLYRDLCRQTAVLDYKSRHELLWVVVLGGTGTGKSTLFNALAGAPLSRTGVERPKTQGPIALVSDTADLADGFPFADLSLETFSGPAGQAPVAGQAGALTLVTQNRTDRAHLVLVDTPDLDSVETENQRAAESLYLLADAAVFVTSQEKYADEVPFRFLRRVHTDGRPCFLLLNKAHDRLEAADVLSALTEAGLKLDPKWLWLIPRLPAEAMDRLSEEPAFADFARSLAEELSAEKLTDFRQAEQKRRQEQLADLKARLRRLLETESRAIQGWQTELERLFEEACRDLVAEQRERFNVKSKEYLQAEIRRLFARYDLLAGPRRAVQSVLLGPLRLLGLVPKPPKDAHRQALERIREGIDLTPVQSALDHFNRAVLEGLSPEDEAAPLFKALRRSGVLLTDAEIKSAVWQEQEALAVWLEKRFQEMARSIPTGKRWGIYSTTFLWELLIVSVSSAVGGGFTAVDAVIDSALAPFVSKGAVELFAYQEVKTVGRELAQKYQEGFLAVVRRQHRRYRDLIASLSPPLEILESLK